MKRVLVLADELLEKIDGHNFEYCKSVKEIYEANGYKVIVYGNKKVAQEIQESIDAIPFFDFNPQPWFRKIPLLGSIIYRATFWLSLKSQYSKLISNHKNTDTEFFVPNIYWFNVWPIFEAFKKIESKSMFLFRLAINDFTGVPQLMLPIVRSFYNTVAKDVGNNQHLKLVTDSSVIANQWMNIHPLKMEVLPIPHIKEVKIDIDENTSLRKRIYAPGVMRMEKGMDLIFQSLLEIEQNNIELAQQIVFVIQFFGAREKEILDSYKNKLEQFNNINVEILGSLSSLEYHTEIHKADIILIPYVASCGYEARTSGVMCEAIGASKPFITSINTWMQAASITFKTGLAVAENKDAICRAINSIINNYDTYNLQAKNAKKDFLAFHSTDTFYNIISNV